MNEKHKMWIKKLNRRSSNLETEEGKYLKNCTVPLAISIIVDKIQLERFIDHMESKPYAASQIYKYSL